MNVRGILMFLLIVLVLKVQARDVDQTSEIRYSIVDPEDSAFWIDPFTGKVGVKTDASVEMGSDNNHVILSVLATDGVHNVTCTVDIAIRDVNNHAPVFDTEHYNATVLEDASIGTEVAQVLASDMDSGVNAEIKYSIQKGALDAFVVDNETGVVTVSSKLDYDKRNTYRINIIASDKGMPSLTGTTELVVQVINVNDKVPYFTPQIQRAEVSADAEIDTIVHTLIAMDPDVTNSDELMYELSSTKLVKAVDKNGKEVTDEGIFNNWFSVWPNGSVVVSRRPDRTRAAVLTLPVVVTDTSATTLQQADGELIITVVDVNRHAPVFPQSQYFERLPEEQPVGTVLGTYIATDKETPIAYYEITPPNAYFHINNVTGTVKSSQRIDYEKIRRVDFNVVAYDSGVPQLYGTANVLVEVLNINDEEPVFDNNSYEAKVPENSKEGTLVVTVHASDADEGQYGEVRYNLVGEFAPLFTIDSVGGDVRVARGADLDREATTELWLQAIAADNAPDDLRHMTRVPIHIVIEDVNDNSPVFTQNVYKSTIAENLRLEPPAVILQVLAEDRDTGVNGQIKYEIIEQKTFTVDAMTGIIYPSKPVVGNTTYHLTVTATDQAGEGRGAHMDVAKVDIYVASVNKHKPVFVVPPTPQHVIEIPENAAQADLLVLAVKATDEDTGENGRISYHLKVDNENIQETQEFTIDEQSGELRTKTFLDREHNPSYQLVVVARDHGSPGQFEALVFLTVLVQDTNDNVPRFAKEFYEFAISENQPAGIIIGSLKAQDKDAGENGKVYYHILDGNQYGAFTLDRTQGLLRANISFDREKRSEYSMTVYASNDPILERPVDILEAVQQRQENATNLEYDRSVARVTVNVLDENDNEPKFQKNIYYAGVKNTARLNEPVITVTARDDDFEENGTLAYVVAASNLYKFGDQKSSGSIVPSPFNITQDGVVTTANFMSEYNQDRFVLEVLAQEVAPPHRRAVAHVHIWIISGAQTLRMVLSRACSLAERVRAELERRVSAATGAIVVAHALRQHVRDGRIHEHWCEVELHAVETRSQQALAADSALALVDARYDQLRDLYRDAGVETVVAAASPNKVREEFDPALAALIALLIVLFTGVVTFIVVCACLKHWVVSPPSMESSKGDSLARRRILDELSTTENPLWLENKLRPYEEQELTMNVFGEQSAENTSENVDQPPPVDNPYATIQGSRATERCGEYATLGRSSPTPLEAALGFQVGYTDITHKNARPDGTRAPHPGT
ncbi:Cadherin-87A [Eumeta japonica]|uniref:Cadherin-87A n=1 Tax=Eumeta variegata TaxID=151549 RepID=A0A4C1WKV5_EUMVA|nr:Cadherin-87A [Eumeta japonica]